jgi:hypothetical protein
LIFFLRRRKEKDERHAGKKRMEKPRVSTTMKKEKRKIKLTAINAPSVVDIPASVESVRACFSPALRWSREETGIATAESSEGERVERRRSSDDNDDDDADDESNSSAGAALTKRLLLELLFRWERGEISEETRGTCRGRRGAREERGRRGERSINRF